MSSGAFTQDQSDTLTFVTRVASSLSLAGCAFIILTFIRWKDLRDRFFGMRLVYYISIADIITAIGYLLPVVFGEGYLPCEIQGFILTFGHLSAYFWTTSFCYSLYKHVKGISNDELKNYEPIYHSICWSLPLAVAIIYESLNVFISIGPWCWVSHSYPGLRFLLFYGPLIFCILINTFMYISTFITLSSSTNRSAVVLQRRIMYYAFVGIFSMSFGLANRVQNWIAPDHPLFWLNFLQSIFHPLQGFLNVIVYGITLPILKQRYSNVLSPTQSFAQNPSKAPLLQ